MSNSKLISYTKLSPNFTKMKNKVNKKITIHHMAGNCTIENCGEIFAAPSRKASSNYGIGSDGRIALYVDESNRSWCSSSRSNDEQAITIEVANNSKGPNWTISDKAYTALLNLVEDICKRNGIKELNYTGDKDGNLTRHNMFADTNCPGPYLQGKLPAIAEEINKRLGAKVAPQANILSRGSRGDAVKALQEDLIKLGYSMSPYGADGSFGGTTHKAVVAFQKSRGLKQDGIVGAQTQAEIDEAIAELNKRLSYSEKDFIKDVQRCLGAGVDGKAGPITLGKTITVSRKKNNKHPVVKFIQKRLYALGYTEVGEADGSFGPATEKAVKNFQKTGGGSVDGEITAKQKTWKRLLGMK